jgi:hypothetical protein
MSSSRQGMSSSRKKSVWNPGLEVLDHFQLQQGQQQQAAAKFCSSDEFDKEAEDEEEQRRRRQEENGNDGTRQVNGRSRLADSC